VDQRQIYIQQTHSWLVQCSVDRDESYCETLLYEYFKLYSLATFLNYLAERRTQGVFYSICKEERWLSSVYIFLLWTANLPTPAMRPRSFIVTSYWPAYQLLPKADQSLPLYQSSKLLVNWPAYQLLPKADQSLPLYQPNKLLVYWPACQLLP
jgi:hypothetical protein